MTVTLVTGPPCAGKTTYVRQHAGPRDLVLDQDTIGPAEMRAQLARLTHHHGAAWVIRCCPGAGARQALATQLGATLVHLQPDTPTLLARAKARPHPHRHVAAIRKWLAQDAAGGRTTPDPTPKPRTTW